ncbi:MAG: Na+/H+ antiporter subunit E [Lautropia sp.]|nr:Na+/H+ antiporter subunit E [Lautropia sp.]
MKSLLPAPLLSLCLLLLWLVLNGSVAASHIVLGLLIAIIVPLSTQSLRPTRLSISNPRAVVVLMTRVFLDMLRGNLEVCWRVFRYRGRPPRSQWVVVPLQLKDPNGLAVLAAISAATPGTVWCELAMDRSRLLFHVFHVPEGQDFAAWFKARYETLLMEIFE